VKPKYRLLALDIDGTLLNQGFGIEPTTIDKLAAISARGVDVVLCSGRRFSAALEYAQQLGLPGPIVVNNGTVVKDAASGKTIFADYFPRDQLERVLRLLKELDLPAVVLTDEYPDYDFYVDTVEDTNEYHSEFVRLNRDMANVVEDLASVQSERISQVDVFHAYPTLLAAEERIQRRMNGAVGSVVVRHVKYKGSSLEIAAPEATKWKALVWVARQRGIQPEEIVAIGDDFNDIEMVRDAGYGVAVANALDEVKEVADYVTTQPRYLGVEEAIEMLFLE
jgi:Cof subfamily protein (haloacid dehalogenase superfamily)